VSVSASSTVALDVGGSRWICRISPEGGGKISGQFFEEEGRKLQINNRMAEFEVVSPASARDT